MAFMKQMFYLVKQELQSARRSRYIVISFVILPIFMWVLQGGVQVIANNSITSAPANLTIYMTNEETQNVTIVDNFTIPFAFDGYSAGDNVTTNTSFPLADYFVSYIKWYTNLNFTGNTLYNAKIIDNQSVSSLETLKEQGKINYWLKINSSFSEMYNNEKITSVQLDYLTTGLLGPIQVQAPLMQILSQKPFSVIDYKRVGHLDSTAIVLQGETSDASQSYAIGFAGFIGILLAVMAPAPFVSTSFAGEREKKTLESLLALPVSRKSILLGKLMAGMVLVGVFSVLNIVGMFLFTKMTSSLGDKGSSYLAFDLTPTSVIAITLAMGLSAFIAIGLGISIASFAKDVRTSESLYQFVLMIPSMLVGFSTLFVGVPENIGGAALLLYLIPFTHSIAIFQKMLRPAYYDANSLLGFGLYVDLLFHIVFLVLSILLILYFASKVFEREGIVN